MANTDRPALVTRTDALRALYADQRVTIERLIEHGDVVLALLTLGDGSAVVDVARFDDRGVASVERVGRGWSG